MGPTVNQSQGRSERRQLPGRFFWRPPSGGDGADVHSLGRARAGRAAACHRGERAMTEGKKTGLGERLKALQAKAEAGDRKALEELITLIRPQLLAAAAALGGKKHASSIAQEACLRLAQGIETGTDVENVLAFSRRIVRNLTIDQARREGRRPAVALPPEHLGNLPASTGTPSSNAARAEMLEELRDKLGRLAPTVRRVVEDRYFEELGWEELAAKHGLASGEAARKMVERALATLGERTGHE